jgi:hypothetical protein
MFSSSGVLSDSEKREINKKEIKKSIEKDSVKKKSTTGDVSAIDNTYTYASGVYDPKTNTGKNIPKVEKVPGRAFPKIY